MNGTALIAVGIVCFTLLLLGGMWKADRDAQRALVKELSTRQPIDAQSLIGGVN